MGIKAKESERQSQWLGFSSNTDLMESLSYQSEEIQKWEKHIKVHDCVCISIEHTEAVNDISQILRYPRKFKGHPKVVHLSIIKQVLYIIHLSVDTTSRTCDVVDKKTSKNSDFLHMHSLKANRGYLHTETEL